MLAALLDVLADRESGASEIERRLSQRWLAAEPADPLAALDQLTGVILQRYPAMVNLMGWLDSMWQLCEAGEVGRVERLRSWLGTRLVEIEQAPIAIGKRLVPFLEERPIVFTLSRSGTVFGALAAAKLAGVKPKVRVAESRPESEGLLLAADLLEQGIETTALPDFTLASLLGGFEPRGLDLASGVESSLLLLGADGVTVDAFVNKSGTASLARTARAAGVPVLVAVGADKLLPPRLAPMLRIAAEPWNTGHGRVPGRRFDFERVPAELVDRFVLPDAELTAGDLEKYVAERRISNHLSHRLNRAGSAQPT